MPRRQRVAAASAPVQKNLCALMDAIVNGETAAVGKLLASAPSLAAESLVIGATRQRARDFFYPEIGHYLYGGDTPLHAAAAGYRNEIAKALLGVGANVAAANRRGATPLHYAADGHPNSRGWNPEAQPEMISLLVGAGADPNALDKSGVAPLHRAVRQRCLRGVEALLRGGAAIGLKNKSGSAPLHLAVQNTGRGGSGSPESKALQKKIIELLLNAGANPKDRDGRGKTAMECTKSDWIQALL